MNRPTRTILVLMFITLACNIREETRDSFILAAVQNRPGMEIRDLYKLLYQGRFGIGHLISSREAARAYLLQEIAALPEGPPNEPLLELCSPNGRMVRVNLRPFVQRGLAPENLLDAMLESLRATQADTTAFRRDWDTVGALIRDGRLLLDPAIYMAFSREMEEAGLPAVHHSDSYTALYRPAYRVVLREIFLNHFPGADAR